MDRGTPKILVDNPGGKVNTKEVRDSYNKKIALKCTKGCVLSEVITCYSRRSDHKTGQQSMYACKIINEFVYTCSEKDD